MAAAAQPEQARSSSSGKPASPQALRVRARAREQPGHAAGTVQPTVQPDSYTVGVVSHNARNCCCWLVPAAAQPEQASSSRPVGTSQQQQFPALWDAQPTAYASGCTVRLYSQAVQSGRTVRLYSQAVQSAQSGCSVRLHAVQSGCPVRLSSQTVQSCWSVKLYSHAVQSHCPVRLYSQAVRFLEKMIDWGRPGETWAGDPKFLENGKEQKPL